MEQCLSQGIPPSDQEWCDLLPTFNIIEILWLEKFPDPDCILALDLCHAQSCWRHLQSGDGKSSVTSRQVFWSGTHFPPGIKYLCVGISSFSTSWNCFYSVQNTLFFWMVGLQFASSSCLPFHIGNGVLVPDASSLVCLPACSSLRCFPWFVHESLRCMAHSRFNPRCPSGWTPQNWGFGLFVFSLEKGERPMRPAGCSGHDGDLDEEYKNLEGLRVLVPWILVCLVRPPELNGSKKVPWIGDKVYVRTCLFALAQNKGLPKFAKMFHFATAGTCAKICPTNKEQ